MDVGLKQRQEKKTAMLAIENVTDAMCCGCSPNGTHYCDYKPQGQKSDTYQDKKFSEGYFAVHPLRQHQLQKEQQQQRAVRTYATFDSSLPDSPCKLFDLSQQGSVNGGDRRCPPIGCRATQGRRARMEDTDVALRGLLPDVPLLFWENQKIVPKAMEDELAVLFDDIELGSPRTPLTRFGSDDSDCGSFVRSRPSRQSSSTSSSSFSAIRGRGGAPKTARSTFHFAGVFDGHGGHTVSHRVAQRLPALVRSSVWRSMHPFCTTDDDTTSSAGRNDHQHHDDEDVETPSMFARKLSRSKAMSDNTHDRPRSTVTTRPTANNRGWSSSTTVARRRSMSSTAAQQTPRWVTIDQVADGLTEAFKAMDEELKDEEAARNSGSTAVVSLVSSEHIFVANCGDSRAVLGRAGGAYRLSRDHKPDLDDEQDRIRKYGGKVLDYNGRRVMGLLAMSRAFGDLCLRDSGVIADPEITVINRTEEDEFLVLGSDGLWDALEDREVCDLTRKCFQRAQERGAEPEKASRVAASVLMRAALDHGSSDNITVLVIDLRAGI